LLNYFVSLFFQGIDINQEVDGRPPLLYAADYGQLEVIDYLLAKGANANVRAYKVNLVI